MSVTVYNRRHFLHTLAAASALSGTMTNARANGPGREEVIEGAKSESGLIWYDHYDADAARSILTNFQRAYPFVKKVEFVDVPSAQKTAKVVQESMAGGPTADVLLHGASVTQSLYQRGFLLESDWAALGVATSPVLTPSAYMIVATTAPYAALCNTNLVKGADIPQTWNDMADARWKGRTGHWMRAAFFVDIIPAIGESASRDLVKRLAALRPRMFDGQFPLAEAVGSGEIALAITAYDSAVRMVEKSAPVKLVLIDPTPVPLIVGSVLKYGKNPNTARLFLAWLGRPEGAIMFEKYTKRGNYFVNGTEISKVLKGHMLSYYTAAESIAQASKLNALETEFSRTLTGR
ncbi:MAG: ABC transporter substrate-binding protein [Xanthobacteraceae bacterium]